MPIFLRPNFLHAEEELPRMNVTLDTNCLIALEESEPEAPFLRQLITFHDVKKINLRVVAISASERKPDGTYASNFAEFQQKIAAVGLGNVEILTPIAYSGITFAEWCLAADDEMIELERKIQEVLFPTIHFDYETYNDDRNHDNINVRRRNAKCDVLAMWSHVRFNGDVFVTSDMNFHKQRKKDQLIALGAGNILKPQEAVSTIVNS
jgi:hypothetical protein